MGLRSGFICEPLDKDARDYPATGDLDAYNDGSNLNENLAYCTSIGVVIDE